MRQPVGVTAVITDPVAKAVLQPCEELLVAGLAASKHSQCEAALLQQIRHDLLNQFDAFLIGQTRHHADQWHIVAVVEFEFLQQRGLVLLLAGQPLRAELVWD